MDSYEKILILSYIKDINLNENEKIISYNIYDKDIRVKYCRKNNLSGCDEIMSYSPNYDELLEVNSFQIYKRNFYVEEILEDDINYDAALLYLENIFEKNRKKVYTLTDKINDERKLIDVGSQVMYRTQNGIVTYKHNQKSGEEQKFTIKSGSVITKYVPLSYLVKKNVKVYSKEQIDSVPKMYKEMNTKKLLQM